MEGSTKFILVALVVLALISDLPPRATAQMNVCGMTRDDLTACMPSVRLVNPIPPSENCCKAIADADLTCLCSYQKSSVLPAIGINPAEAMKLPAKCNVNPAFHCKDA
ncbi:hypothetical protein Droror1_Dr00016648 [Drosera rotundifolia]